MNRTFRIIGRAMASLLMIPAVAKAAIPMSVYQGMVVPLPRQYANQGAFWSLHGGINSPDSISLDANVTTTQFANTPNINLKGSYNFGATVGYRYKRLRSEIELSYHNNDVRKVRSLPAGYNNIGSDCVGKLTAVFITANFLWDFHFTNGINPYIGIGLGGAYAEYNAPFLNSNGKRISFGDTEFNLAYQAILGVGYVFTDHLEVDFCLKYFESRLGNFSLSQADYPTAEPVPPSAASEKVEFEPKSYGGTLFTLEARFN